MSGKGFLSVARLTVGASGSSSLMWQSEKFPGKDIGGRVTYRDRSWTVGGHWPNLGTSRR